MLCGDISPQGRRNVKVNTNVSPLRVSPGSRQTRIQKAISELPFASVSKRVLVRAFHMEISFIPM